MKNRLRELRKKIAQHYKMLSKPLYTGEHLEKNLQALFVLGIVMVVFGTVMTVLNCVQEKGLLILTSAAFLADGVFVILSAKVFRNRKMASVSILLVSAVVFTYYSILGSNGGFSVLWLMLMPCAICYFLSVRFGILLSIYFEVLVIVMFYTPLRAHFAELYTETFMTRFPILYLCEIFITLVSMSQYHENSLMAFEYADRLNEEVKRQTEIANLRANKLERLSDEMVQALARAIDAKDKYTNGHSFRVSRYSVALAKKIGWSEGAVKDLQRESLLHDIGKIGVSDAVLNKPGKLTPEEYEAIKAHTTIGSNILEGLEDMQDIADIIRYHHERYDGKGYPTGLSGKDIPEGARIVAIADAYDAMNSDRVYRPALPKERIRAELEKGCGVQFDPDILPKFLELLDDGELDRNE